MIVDSILRVKFSELTPQQSAKLEKDLTYMSNNDVVISYNKQLLKGEYQLPRGAWFLMPDSIRYVDNRSKPPAPILKFTLTLDDISKDERFKGQKQAVAAMLREEQGLIIRPPGTGKTQIATAFAAACGTPTLVLVHTEDILQQWVEYVERSVPSLKGEVGVIRGKVCRIGHITIATVQTLYRSYLDKGKKWWAQWGCVIADEGHHVAAPTWEAVLNTIPAFYRFGFTASATRADGMHPSMRFIVGPVIHRQKFSSPIKLTVKTKSTKFHMNYRGPFDWPKLLDELVRDKGRNRLIAKVADAELEKGNTVLVLSRRIEHLELVARAMSENCEILTGSRSKEDRKRILDSFRAGEIRCLLSTQLADEALDVQRLNRVLLTFPGKHEGRIIQQIGRALRTHAEKEDAVIYDFVDRRIGVLRRQAAKRRQTYKANGISVKGSRKLKLKGRG